MTDNYENGYQAGRFDGYVEAMEMARDEYGELRAALERFKAWADRWGGARSTPEALKPSWAPDQLARSY